MGSTRLAKALRQMAQPRFGLVSGSIASGLYASRHVRGIIAPANRSRVYYDYNQQPAKRSFWQKHRDKLTVAAGAGGGALLGALVGGKKGAAIGALAGGGGAAVYTYGIRKRNRRY